MRVALYARYSSDNQRDASIEDQLRICRLHAEKQGWTLVDTYTDRAISGASLLRPGIQELMQDALQGKFDIILAEAMDRLSRDQEDIAGLFKRMTFANVRIVTLSEGEVGHLHIGLKGTMNALFLKDLADKTRRGLRGRVEHGKSGGGLCYGYDVVKAFTAEGELLRGGRTINPPEAEIVRRIFKDYNEGQSPRAIAFELNRQNIPGPEGSEWGFSTILGNQTRGTGILNNELYIGRLVWNRLRYIKDPNTGKRVSRLNPETAWVIHEVPELRIIDQDLWDKTRRLYKSLSMGPKDPQQTNWMNDRRRAKHLLSGLVKCGCCGGGYTLISKYMLGCATARNKGELPVYMRLNLATDMPQTYRLQGSKGIMEVTSSTITFSPQSGTDSYPSYYAISFPRAMREAYEKRWHQENDARLAREAMSQTLTFRGPEIDDVRPHLTAFFDAVRSRKPVVEDVVFGHNAALACHMANESYFRKTAVHWDEASKTIRS